MINYFSIGLFHLLLVQPTTQYQRFCSVLCLKDHCLTSHFGDCDGGCSPPWIWNQTNKACELVNSDYKYIQSTGETGIGNLSVNFGYSGFCNCTNRDLGNPTCSGESWNYSFYGDMIGRQVLNVADSIGTNIPHYQLRIIAWVILIDFWWDSNILKVTLDRNQTKIFTKSEAQSVQNVCGDLASHEHHIRFDRSFSHNTSLPYSISITTNNTNSKWGVKQVLVLAKLCHHSCTSCFGQLISQCTSCEQNTPMLLSGTTCNQTCLPGYGYMHDNKNCVFCDIKCVTCFQLFHNCSVCKSSGPHASFLLPYNSSCQIACPLGMYSNAVDRTCYFCDVSCQSCKNSPTYCLLCDASMGYAWYQFNCYNPCPFGTFLSNNGQNCSECSSLCISCQNKSTVCTECKAYGVNASYLLGTDCLIQCPSGYLTDSTDGINRCNICGDGLKLGEQQCDDGNSFFGDGCNPNCTIGNMSCTSSFPFRDPITNICSESCPGKYFNNYTTFICSRCFYTCTECINQTSCTFCLDSNRYLADSSCLPIPGFFDNSQYLAVKCISPCQQCLSISNCLTCTAGYFIQDFACLKCSQVISYCQQCSTKYMCQKCQQGYGLNIASFCQKIIFCLDKNCLYCRYQFQICQICKSGYLNVNGSCLSYCGNFFLGNEQQCDDGNLNENDGCSPQCKIEKDYMCELKMHRTVCFYTGNLAFIYKHTKKIDNKNEIQIKLDLSPANLSFWQVVNFNDVISLSQPVPSNIISLNILLYDGFLLIQMLYQIDIQDCALEIKIDVANSKLPKFSKIAPQTIKMIINPDDNKAAYYFSATTYDRSNIVSKFSLGLSILSLILFVIGATSARIVAVEMMGVFQATLISLIALSKMNPSFSALTSLKWVNGYNELDLDPLQDVITPNGPKGIYLFSSFIKNFNISMALIFMPMLGGFFCIILSRIVPSKSQKILVVAKRSLGQFTFMGILFSEYLVSASFFLQLQYGIQKTGLQSKASLVEAIIMFLMMVFYFFFLIFKPKFFGQFATQIKQGPISNKYFNLVILSKFLTGSSFIFLISTNFSLVFNLALNLLVGIFIILAKPFKRIYHNCRAFANALITLAIQGIYLAYDFRLEMREENIFSFLPLVVCLLLLLCLLYNGGIIIYKISSISKEQYENQIPARQVQNQTSLNQTKTNQGLVLEGRIEQRAEENKIVIYNQVDIQITEQNIRGNSRNREVDQFQFRTQFNSL